MPKHRTISATRPGQDDDNPDNHSRTIPGQDADHCTQKSGGDSMGYRNKKVGTFVTSYDIQNNGQPHPDAMPRLNKDADIYLINLENVAWLCGLSDKLVFTNLVIDESSRFKDPSTKRFKALKKHLKGFSRRLILTGTPTPQGMQDLWSQVGILDLGQPFGD